MLASPQANAWFVILPFGLIARALEKDPDKIEVSYKDRLAGKCAGYHVNQASGTSKSDEEKTFHSAMSDKALEGADNKEKTKDLAEAYSTKWGRAAQVDFATNRAYGTDLAGGCRANGIALSLVHQKEMKRQEEAKLEAEARRQEEAKRQEEARQQEETKRQEEARQQEEAKRQEEARQQEEAKRQEEARQQEEARRQEEMKLQEEARQQEEAKRKASKGGGKKFAAAQPPTARSIDFNAEARKSALILGCSASDPKVTGVDGKNIVFSITCAGGASLTLSCDPTGLCLKK
jgi:flagellar biosynthesis GTPase FlhF